MDNNFPKNKIINHKSKIFNSENREFPHITLTPPLFKLDLSSSCNHSPCNNSNDLDFLEDFGLLQVSQSPTSSKFSRFSKITLVDFMGEKNTEKIIEAKKLRPLRRDQKKKNFLRKIVGQVDLHKPTSPNVMDENTKLRLFLQKSRRDELNKTNKRKNSLSLSPCMEYKTHSFSKSVSGNPFLGL